MNTNLKSLPESLRNSECKKGMLSVQPPIPYVPPSDLHEKRETEQIKVELPEGTKFQMSTYGIGNNKEYLIHIIAVMRMIKQKGTAADVKEAFAALVEVRKEMSPLFNFPDNKTASKKHNQKNKLNKFKEIFKAKKDLAIAEAQKAYELFRCFVIGKAQMQWDWIVNKMHNKNPWIGVNGPQGPSRTFLAFLRGLHQDPQACRLPCGRR